MGKTTFNNKLADAQATAIEPMAPEDFPLDDYAAYEAATRERAKAFWAADRGVLVYRRMRVGEVFSFGCRDMAASLRWQLGALSASMDYPADLPNFLEPWYGIGTIASAFGSEYIWKEGQSPAMLPRFASAREALAAEPVPVAQTAIGRHTLAIIDYFMEQTGGRVPMSLTDTQSPLDIACNIVNVTQLMLDFLIDPEAVTVVQDRIADLQVDFAREQLARMGDTPVWPGHGFASSRDFGGLGQSDDNVLMLSDEIYRALAAPSLSKAGHPFGGPVFHSCGNWSAKAAMIRTIDGLRVVDAAFGAETDPNPNPPEPFPEVFAGTGIVLNARIVGDVAAIEETVRKLWRPDMKLIVVTYCKSPAEQAEAYDRIHAICGC